LSKELETAAVWHKDENSITAILGEAENYYDYKVQVMNQTTRIVSNVNQEEILNGDELVRRQDVEQLIKDSMEDYDERINNAKNIPHAWNLALEKLLEEVQNE